MQTPANHAVFLSEPDSVRRSAREIELGQWAIFTEIVRNGHVVVLSFNQVADSYTLMNMLLDDRSRDAVLRLFRLGWLQVNAFGSYYTLADYISSVTTKKPEEKETFLFSWLPVQQGETFLLSLIRKAVTSSNTAMFPQQAHPAPRDLWILNAEIEPLLAAPNALTPQEKEVLQALKKEIQEDYARRMSDIGKFISIIVQLSATGPAIHPKKAQADIRYDYLALLHAILWMPNIHWCACGLDPKLAPLVEQARNQLRRLASTPEGRKLHNRNNRSDWSYKLKAFSTGQTSPQRDALQMANALIDLCYHYASEESVLHVLKHFDDSGLLPLPALNQPHSRAAAKWLRHINARRLFQRPDFLTVFVRHLNTYWQGHRSLFLARDTDELLAYRSVRHWHLWDDPALCRGPDSADILHTPDWNLALATVHNRPPTLPSAPPPCTYPLQTKAFRPHWRRWRFVHALGSGLGLLASFLLILVLAHSETFLDTVIGRIFPLNLDQTSQLTKMLVSVLVTSALVSLLSSLVPWCVSQVRRSVARLRSSQPSAGAFHIPDILDFYKKMGRSLLGWVSTTVLYRKKYRALSKSARR